MLDSSLNCTAQVRSLLDDYQVLQYHILDGLLVFFWRASLNINLLVIRGALPPLA